MTGRRRPGRPATQNPRTADVKVKVTPDQKRRLERLAERRGKTVAGLIRPLIEGLVGPPIP
jgi:predicted DNA-binding protein